MQVEGFHGRFGGSVHTLFRTVTEEGVLAVYKGAAAPMVGWGLIDSFLWFGLLEARKVVRKVRAYESVDEFRIWEHAGCGMVAGWTVTLHCYSYSHCK